MLYIHIFLALGCVLTPPTHGCLCSDPLITFIYHLRFAAIWSQGSSWRSQVGGMGKVRRGGGSAGDMVLTIFEIVSISIFFISLFHFYLQAVCCLQFVVCRPPCLTTAASLSRRKQTNGQTDLSCAGVREDAENKMMFCFVF